MSFSAGFKINVNKLNADEVLLILLEIQHPFLTDPVRLVNDNRDFVFNGNNYMGTSFNIKRQNDVQGELPMVTLTVPNVGRSLVKWIDESGGGKDAILTIILSRRSTPTVEEERLSFQIQTVNITTDSVVFNMVVENNLIKRAMRWVYDQYRAPGLF